MKIYGAKCQTVVQQQYAPCQASSITKTQAPTIPASALGNLLMRDFYQAAKFPILDACNIKHPQGTNQVDGGCGFSLDYSLRGDLAKEVSFTLL